MPKQRSVVHNRGFAEYFRELRQNRGWSLNRAVMIAEQRRLPVSRGSLRWLEGGLTKRPEPGLLRALSVLYDEPYRNIVRQVAKHVYSIEPEELLEEGAPAASVEGFVTLPVLAEPIAAGHPLSLTPDPKHDNRLAFRKDFIIRFTRPVVLRAGRKVAAMKPTIEPGDVVLVDQNVTRRRRPAAGRVFAINEGPLTGADGGTLARIDRSGHTLILSADHPDKAAYPTRTFDIAAAALPDVLLGEVVWVGRTMGTTKRR